MNTHAINHALADVILAALAGRPGCGKEFTGDRLLEMEAGYGRIIMSQVIDHEKTRGSGIGRLMQQYKDAGKLVPDEHVTGLFLNEVAALHAEGCKTILIDGFPRTRVQRSELKRRNARLVTFHLELHREKAIGRMLERNRPGETLELCNERQDVFEAQTLPAILEIRAENPDLFIEIDGSLESEVRAAQIHENILRISQMVKV